MDRIGPLRHYTSRLLALSVVASFAAVGCSKSSENNDSPNGMVNNLPDMSASDVEPSDVTDGGGDMADGALTISGLSAPVDVKYDENGVLHLGCETDRDCYAAQGYFHARDRFVQMDFLRGQTRGELSRMIGLAFMRDSDVWWRHVMSDLDGEPLEAAYYAAASERTKDAFVAYAEGVNGWLQHMKNGQHGASLSAEYSSGLLYEAEKIRDWEPQDTVTLYLQLSFQYAWGRSAGFKGRIAADYGDEIASDLFDGDFAIRSAMTSTAGPNTLRPLPESHELPDLSYLKPAAQALRVAARRDRAYPSLLFGQSGPEALASNWFALGPDRTADNSAILANDPHLDMQNPSIWYIVQMHSDEGLHVAGASVPGAPGVIAGHNEKIAWGVTVSMFHVADAYIETLTADGLGVMRDGSRVDIVQKEHVFEGRFDDEHVATLEWVPDHGPIIGKDMDAGTAVTLKWVHQTPSNDIDFLIDLLHAGSVEEADTALDPIRGLNINWSVADTDGNIAWFPKAQLPQRAYISADQPWWLPLPGDGSAEWGPPIDSDDYYRIVNPMSGYINSTNNELDDRYVDGDPYNDAIPHLWAQQAEEGQIRHLRANQLVEASSAHDIDSIAAVQLDIYSNYGETILPVLLPEAAAFRDQLSPSALGVLTTLEEWDYLCPTGLTGHDMVDSPVSDDPAVVTSATGCTAFHVLLKEVSSALTADETEGNIDWLESAELLTKLLLEPQRLQHGEQWFDDTATPEIETRTDHLLAGFEAAAAYLTETFDSANPDDWIWGRIHGAVLPSYTGLPAYSLGPVATEGGYCTLNKANPANNFGSAGSGAASDYQHIDGPAIRAIYQLTPDGIEARFQLPGGQVHSNPDSPLHDNLLQRWLDYEYTVIPFSTEDVDAAPAADELVLRPTE